LLAIVQHDSGPDQNCGMASDLRGMLRLAFPRALAPRDRLMLTLHAYFDESGTHDSAQAIAVAGYISTAEQWELFNDEWSSALSEWSLKFFHMTDFANRANEYSGWSDEDRRLRFARLARIIDKHTIASIAVGFMRKSYDLTFDRQTKRFVGGPYGTAATMCFVEAAQKIRPLFPSAKIAYVFESGGVGSGQILSVFKMNESDPENREHFKLLSLRFENKRDFAPLQAADILAYELYRNIPKRAGADGTPPRRELVQLVPESEHSIRAWGWVNDDGLMSFAQVLQAAWHHHGRLPMNEVADKLRKQDIKSKR
jgi:hypothetical protein